MMYEIWLGLNIVWELALMHKAWVIPAGTIMLILLASAIVRPPRAGRRAPVFAAGVVSAIAAFLLLPGATMAGFADLGYWVDWLLLFALSVAIGVAVAISAAGLCALIPDRWLRQIPSSR